VDDLRRSREGGDGRVKVPERVPAEWRRIGASDANTDPDAGLALLRDLDRRWAT
jgi:hypothetical protein